MALATEKQELMKVYHQQTETWKLVKKDQSYLEQMSTIEETLSKFGLLKNEIKVYLHLARSGEMKAGDLAQAISLHRTETYRILRDLEKRGIVYSIFEKPLKFTAVPLDKAIDLLVDAQKIKIKLLEQEKTNLVEIWQSMPQMKATNTKKELFQILEGEQQVLMKAEELLEKTEHEFKIFASADYLSQLYYSDFSDKLKIQGDKISVTLVTDTSLKSAYFLGQLPWLSDSQRIKDEQGLPCFMISDNKEVLITFQDKDSAGEDDAKKKYKMAAVWTNYDAFAKILGMLFTKIAVS
ncbi:MAG TPA: helix-turn-helix domain-containing protein [Candidatus Nanoarchaeia archaeon]|nr:helix-turn-helix domain-containing protein [Candidatus Nanoarchaeia archaeon]